MTGPAPLAGLKVVEFAGIGPAPFCAMVLADLGADVLRITRPGVEPDPADVTTRSRRALALDLRSADGAAAALELASRADILIEGFRPGVMERLGIGPEAVHARNPRLVYGRMTGWGQTGPLAHAAGHDIDYIAISGALNAIGVPGRPPVPPGNYLGDFGGGGMLLAVGLLAALLEAKVSGRGQVVDAAMSDGAALLSAFMVGWKAKGQWNRPRGENMLDGGAHFYACYECADGKHVAVGAIEPQFYAELRRRAGLADPSFDAQLDAARWPELKDRLAAVFRTRTRAEWCALLEGTDACFAPVLDWDEAPAHPHNAARGTWVEAAGVVQPAPAPRFSRSLAVAPEPPRATTLADALAAWAGAASAAEPSPCRPRWPSGPAPRLAWPVHWTVHVPPPPQPSPASGRGGKDASNGAGARVAPSPAERERAGGEGPAARSAAPRSDDPH